MRVSLGAALLGLILLPAVGFAEPQEVEIVSKAEVEVEKINEEGEKIVVRQAAEKVMPGETVIFTNTFTNKGEEPAENIVITNPIPAHMNYIDGSAFGAKAVITFSVDGGESFDRPGNLRLPAADGSLILPAEADDFTHVRWTWTEPLQTQQTEEVGFRARLE